VPDYCSLHLPVAEIPKALATEIAESELADKWYLRFLKAFTLI
jgi:hypothetical protein